MKRFFVSACVAIVLLGVLIARISLVKADVVNPERGTITIIGLVYDESHGRSKPVSSVSVRLQLCSSQTFSTTSSPAGVYRLVIPKKQLNQCKTVTLIARVSDAPYRRYRADITVKSLIANPIRHIPLKPIVVATPTAVPSPVPTYTPSPVPSSMPSKITLTGTVYNSYSSLEPLYWGILVKLTFCHVQPPVCTWSHEDGTYALELESQDLLACDKVTIKVSTEYGDAYSAEIVVTDLLANPYHDIIIVPGMLHHATYTPAYTPVRTTTSTPVGICN